MEEDGPLPNWPRRADVTYQHLREFSEELRKWYFDEGGIFLSHKARDAYGALQDTVGQVLTRSAKDGGDPTLQPKGGLIGPNYEEEYEKVRFKCSDLRSQIDRRSAVEKRSTPVVLVLEEVSRNPPSRRRLSENE